MTKRSSALPGMTLVIVPEICLGRGVIVYPQERQRSGGNIERAVASAHPGERSNSRKLPSRLYQHAGISQRQAKTSSSEAGESCLVNDRQFAMNWLYITFSICIAAVLNGLAVRADSFRAPAPSNSQFGRQPSKLFDTISTQRHLTINILRERARLITVKVQSKNSSGSGILIQRQGSVYLVLTNEHVLQHGDKYSIQTPDGYIHPASRYTAASFDDNDLGILQFRSNNASYNVATLGNSAKLAAGDKVFASGFPFAANPSDSGGFVFTVGQVSLVIDKALEGGYQVGYTNKIEQGMSGGPVLNAVGDVVAINGIHAYPLWGEPYTYKDGSKPSPYIRELLVHSAWSIPIDTFLRLRHHQSY